MRKTLVLAAAALSLSLLTASAQNVYSVNIVGYVNVVAKGSNAFTLVNNPLDAGTNTLSVICAALPNKSSVQVWNGSGFTIANKAGGVWTPDLTINPGTGFFIRTPIGSADITNTFVGTVAVGPSGITTNSFPVGFSLVGSILPIGGNLNDVGTNTLNLNASFPNKSSVQVWDNSGPGAFVVANRAGGTFTPNLPIAVGQGFFVNPNVATNWIQYLSAP